MGRGIAVDRTRAGHTRPFLVSVEDGGHVDTEDGCGQVRLQPSAGRSAVHNVTAGGRRPIPWGAGRAADVAGWGDLSIFLSWPDWVAL